jgi:hypothetical protein
MNKPVLLPENHRFKNFSTLLNNFGKILITSDVSLEVLTVTPWTNKNLPAKRQRRSPLYREQYYRRRDGILPGTDPTGFPNPLPNQRESLKFDPRSHLIFYSYVYKNSIFYFTDFLI